MKDKARKSILIDGESVINFVTEAMKAQHLNARSLAAKAGLSHMTVYTLLSGEKRPKPETLTAIAPHLGTTGDYLKKLAGIIDGDVTMTDRLRAMFERANAILPKMTPSDRDMSIGMLDGVISQMERSVRDKAK